MVNSATEYQTEDSTMVTREEVRLWGRFTASTKSTMTATYRFGMISALANVNSESDLKYICLACRHKFPEMLDARTHPCNAEARFRMVTGRKEVAKPKGKRGGSGAIKTTGSLAGVGRGKSALVKVLAEEPATSNGDTLNMGAEDFVSRFQDIVTERNSLKEENFKLKQEIGQLRQLAVTDSQKAEANVEEQVDQEVERRLSIAITRLLKAE